MYNISIYIYMLYISIYKARKQESKKIDGFLNKNHIILPVRFLIWICLLALTIAGCTNIIHVVAFFGHLQSLCER